MIRNNSSESLESFSYCESSESGGSGSRSSSPSSSSTKSLLKGPRTPGTPKSPKRVSFNEVVYYDDDSCGDVSEENCENEKNKTLKKADQSPMNMLRNFGFEKDVLDHIGERCAGNETILNAWLAYLQSLKKTQKRKSSSKKSSSKTKSSLKSRIKCYAQRRNFKKVVE